MWSKKKADSADGGGGVAPHTKTPALGMALRLGMFHALLLLQRRCLSDQPPGLCLKMKTARTAIARAASIRPSAATLEEPVAAGTGMVASGVGEGIGVGGGSGVAEGDGGGGVAKGEVGVVVTAAGAWVASAVGTGRGVLTSVGLVSVGAMPTLGMGEGVGEGDGVSVGVSAAGLAALGVGEGRAVAAGVRVSIASGVFVGIGVAVAVGAGVVVTAGTGVAVAAGAEVVVAAGAEVAVGGGAGVAVAAGAGGAVTVGVGASALLTMTWPSSTVTHWTLAAVSNTWTSCNPRVALPSPWAIQVIVAKMPAPLGPAALTRLKAPRVTFPSALFTSGPMATAGFPVLSKKSPRIASVTCTMDGS